MASSTTPSPDLSFLETPERQATFTAAMDFHGMHPEVSIEQHLWRRSFALGNEIAGRQKVYLDTKFWVMLRDVALGRNTEPRRRKLYELLQTLVATEKIICPFSDYCWLELFKQSDGTTLAATAHLVDDLGLGVCIKFRQERFETEMLHFLKTINSNGRPITPLDHLVWTKVSYAIGSFYPSNTMLSPEINLVFQKAFADNMWSITLREMVTILGMSDTPPPSLRIGTAFINEGKFAHADEIKSFERAMESELVGILDAYTGTIRNVLVQYYETCTGKHIAPAERVEDGSTRQLQGILLQAFKKGQLTTELPFINVMAGLYAMYRWDRQRKLEENDIMDFGHAASALPYCDVFLTEKSLKHLVTSDPLCFDKLYGVTVVANEDEAIAALERL